MKILINILITIFLFAGLGLSRSILQDTDYILNNIKTRIELNYYKAEPERYHQIYNHVEPLLEFYKSDWRIFYFAGFVQLQLGRLTRELDGVRAENHFQSAISILKKADSLESSAEIKVLLSSAYGKLASLSIFKAVSYGNLSEEYLNQARSEAQDQFTRKLNLVEATHLMFTPAIFGGDKNRAMKLLKDAMANQTPHNEWLINWAQDAELYAYLAQLENEKGNLVLAKYYCRKALEIQPEYKFVATDLINEINEEN